MMLNTEFGSLDYAMDLTDIESPPKIWSLSRTLKLALFYTQRTLKFIVSFPAFFIYYISNIVYILSEGICNFLQFLLTSIPEKELLNESRYEKDGQKIH